MRNQALISTVALATITASLLAQVSSWCRGPVDSFPPPPGGGGPCSGSETVVCEEAPGPGGGFAFGPLRVARCYTWGTGAGSFVHDDCSLGGDPNWTYVGDMGNGVCCYIDTLIVIDPTWEPQGFKIRSCDTECMTGIE